MIFPDFRLSRPLMPRCDARFWRGFRAGTVNRPLASAGVVPGGRQAGSSAAGVWGPEPDRLGW